MCSPGSKSTFTSKWRDAIALLSIIYNSAGSENTLGHQVMQFFQWRQNKALSSAFRLFRPNPLGLPRYLRVRSGELTGNKSISAEYFVQFGFVGQEGREHPTSLYFGFFGFVGKDRKG